LPLHVALHSGHAGACISSNPHWHVFCSDVSPRPSQWALANTTTSLECWRRWILREYRCRRCRFFSPILPFVSWNKIETLNGIYLEKELFWAKWFLLHFYLDSNRLVKWLCLGVFSRL
jgi:hypothetical protein